MSQTADSLPYNEISERNPYIGLQYTNYAQKIIRSYRAL
jgi:hypothetical protein